MPVVVPRRNTQLTMRVEERGADEVTIGGRRLAARHLVLRDPTGGADRDIWVDAQNRVLRVEIPSRHLVALRDDAPRP